MHELANEDLKISVEDVRKAVKKLKGGKSPVKMLECGGEC